MAEATHDAAGAGSAAVGAAGDGYQLPALPYVRLAFTLRALAHAELPEYQGSMLRGAFGHALRKMVCVMPREQECAGCRLRRECVYTRLFETFVEGPPPPLLRGLPTSPRPYVFEPGGDARKLGPGDRFGFDLLLIGQAADLQGFAVVAIERMAADGLGRARHRFEIESVACRESDGTRRDVLRGGSLAAAEIQLPGSDLPDPFRARLHFVTPTRLKVQDRLVATIGFRALVFAMLRRALELAHFHVQGATIDWHFRPLLEAASGVQVSASRLHWRDWQRYSSRQQCKISLGGFVGELELSGDLKPFGPLLRAAEVLHVGKGATFGLGKVELS